VRLLSLCEVSPLIYRPRYMLTYLCQNGDVWKQQAPSSDQTFRKRQSSVLLSLNTNTHINIHKQARAQMQSVRKITSKISRNVLCTKNYMWILKVKLSSTCPPAGKIFLKKIVLGRTREVDVATVKVSILKDLLLLLAMATKNLIWPPPDKRHWKNL
jgi:hypothetical protein